MTGAHSVPSDLLADCDACGIRLVAADDGGLTIDAPQDALTPGLLDRLKAHKADVLALLQLVPNTSVATQDAPADRTRPVCRCGATTWRDVPIHGGQSVRRDCARCGRFLEFPVWYGNNTLHSEQHPVR